MASDAVPGRASWQIHPCSILIGWPRRPDRGVGSGSRALSFLAPATVPAHRLSPATMSASCSSSTILEFPGLDGLARRRSMITEVAGQFDCAGEALALVGVERHAIEPFSGAAFGLVSLAAGWRLPGRSQSAPDVLLLREPTSSLLDLATGIHRVLEGRAWRGVNEETGRLTTAIHHSTIAGSGRFAQPGVTRSWIGTTPLSVGNQRDPDQAVGGELVKRSVIAPTAKLDP